MGERPLDEKIEPLLRLEFNRIAEARKGDKAAQLMEGVGTPTQYFERQVELRPPVVAERGSARFFAGRRQRPYCEVF
jgi:hypothetical protein